MTLTLLFDLDDTLIDTNLDTFVPAYFQALSQHLNAHVAPEIMLPALVSGMSIMTESEDPTQTLEEVFDARFYEKLGKGKEELAAIFDEFYEKVFPTLSALTKQREETASLIRWALGCGFRVAIATDPLFPRKATYQRLRWAGLDPDQLELISTFENFHFTKTHPAYFAEVLGRLGWPEGPILMVGDNLTRDLEPAHRLGLATYWIDGGSAPRQFVTGRGKLADLRPWLESVNWSTLEPSFRSKDAILAILSSTPAVLRSLTSSLSDEEWRHEPTRDDWAMNELVCHLRDTDLEIHQLQIQLLIEHESAFIPRPETGVWANEREYLNVNGHAALSEFSSARVEILKILKAQPEEIWSRKARHAIFGPTNFQEVVGFIADHDRLHIQQAWKTLKSIQTH